MGLDEAALHALEGDSADPPPPEDDGNGTAPLDTEIASRCHSRPP